MGRAIGGVVLALIGSLTLAALVFIANSGSRDAERALFVLGLANTALISAVAQALVIVGLWLLWSAARRRP